MSNAFTNYKIYLNNVVREVEFESWINNSCAYKSNTEPFTALIGDDGNTKVKFVLQDEMNKFEIKENDLINLEYSIEPHQYRSIA